MKGETSVFRGLKCLGTVFSFLINLLVMMPLPAGGGESAVAFVSGNSYFTTAGLATSSTRPVLLGLTFGGYPSTENASVGGFCGIQPPVSYFQRVTKFFL